ncbi:hypothetical protein GCM10017567_73390 [Amycolatopsis bullii]|uniref:Uncharacterized protein n=1 Tax=Amycolatopsis bullii TaxID=941987 RepID=A0ABQ3KX73_9PSEU|nr:hypothetical protein GCM10017567_73390 [Amycolatopsis bullii]
MENRASLAAVRPLGAGDAYIPPPELDLYVAAQRHGADPVPVRHWSAPRVAELNGDRSSRAAASGRRKGLDPNALIMLAWLRRQAAEATASPALLDHKTPLHRNADHAGPLIQPNDDRGETELIG